MPTDASQYMEPFRTAVLQHIQSKLGTHEWARLRAMCQRKGPPGYPPADVAATPETLVNDALSEDGISVADTLVPTFNATQIARIAGQPVYYVERRGIYLWGPGPDSRSTLTVWVTHPAYPPGW